MNSSWYEKWAIVLEVLKVAAICADFYFVYAQLQHSRYNHDVVKDFPEFSALAL